MKLEKQIISLELAKKLKELNCPQKSLFFWTHFTGNGQGFLFGSGEEDIKFFNECRDYKDIGIYKPTHDYPEKEIGTRRFILCSAFTATELGEMLPERFQKGFLTCQKVGLWEVGYETSRGRVIIFKEAKSEADARAKLLIYLIKNKLVEV